MAHKYISAAHIEKLGHKIQEIRERALFNIISKLDNGILFDNDLARSKELVLKLLKWFLFEPCTQEREVFSLLNRIFLSECGGTLVNYLGKCTIKKELLQIRSYIDPQYYSDLEELTKIIEKHTTEVVVPPLQSDVPLSYRTTSSTNYDHVESSATPIIGFVQKGSSVDAQTGNAFFIESDDRVSNSSPTVMVHPILNIDNDGCERYKNILPNYFFNWQPLIEPDRHVILKVESSLMNPTNPPALLHSCEFFSTVLLHDFPAEIFLQRPTIVLEFYNLLFCGSTRIVNAILTCLQDLTKALCIRIFHTNDVSMRNYKLELLTHRNVLTNSPTPSETKIAGNEENNFETGDKFEQPEEVKGLQKSQLPTPKFCFLTVAAVIKYLTTTPCDSNSSRSKSSHSLINFCLNLLEEISDLLRLTVRMEIWARMDNGRSLKIFKDLNEMFLRFGEVLEYFRLESLMSEIKKYRIIYLCLIHICMKMLNILVPITKTDLVLPKILKTALTNSLLDVTLSRMYFKLHCLILDYVKSFSVENIKKYQDIKEICIGMTATVKFKKEHKSLTISESLKLGLEALPSLEFHEDLDFLKILVDTLSEKLTQVSDDSIKISKSEKIVLSLLAYNVNHIKEEMYRLCHKKVSTSIGPSLEVANDGIAGSQILFLLSSNIFIEIASFGMTSENKEIQRYSENILTYILKAKIVVCDAIWDKIVQSLIPALPILACHASKHSTLGKTILYLVDPDNAKELSLPMNTVLKCNLQFLFSEDAYLRDEGFSRVSWLLSAQEYARELLPRVNTLYDTSLATVCLPKRVYDINKIRKVEHFYQPSSLTQVMEVLNSSNIEPVIRRSALNQIGVMLEDPLLHQIFLDANGLKMVMETMKTALIESEYRDYPDSVIAIASILKNLCLYHSSVRQELSLNSDMIFLTLRSLFLYFTEERMKQDATILLFLLIFKDFVRGGQSQTKFSLPKVVIDKLRTPFQCEVHGKNSDYMKENLREIVIADRWSLSSIQIHWNSEVFGGFDNLTSMEKIDYGSLSGTFDGILKLNGYDLNCIKTSSISYCIKIYLNTIQNATSHESIVESIDFLSSYILLHNLSKCFEDKEESILELPWEQTFSRFLKALPSCEEDIILLKNVIQFLVILAPIYFDFGKTCWFSSILKDSSQCILDLLCLDETTNDDIKLVSQELLKLVTVCVREEHHYLDYLNNVKAAEATSWAHIVQIIADSLKFSDTQHFYNLAYLDSLLSCLVHVTAKLGWSVEKNSTARELILSMILNFCELLSAFHRGKGPSAILSVMGLSITRHVLLILNHLVAELRNSKIKNWEMSFFGDTDTENTLFNFIDLWRSRDVVIRAAALQLFNSLAVSAKITKEVIDQIKIDNAHICELGFIVLVDHSESSIVRENAAQMLANFAGHCTPLFSEKMLLGPGKVPVLKKSCTMTVLSFIEEYDFYKNLDYILNQLFTLQLSDVRKFSQKSPYVNGSETSWNSESENGENFNLPTTPSLVKAVINLVHNILILDADNVSKKLQENGLVKMIFRTLCNPAMSISNTSELMLYCDILEMNTSVCTLLTKLVIHNSVCLGTILHTKDCLNLLMSLLNSRIYHVHFPQLIYLKNKLWTEIFNLISALVEYSGDSEGNLSARSLDTITMLSETILDLGNEPFIESICESISCLSSNDLQNSALTSLICLLRLETYRIQEKLSKDKTLESSSLKSLLDTVRTPKTILMSDTKENRTPRTYRSSDTKQASDRLKANFLEEEYFEEILPPKSGSSHNEFFENIEVSFVDNTDMSLMSGAEISKILLHLYDISTLYINKDPIYAKKKSLVIAALSGLLCVSKQAKNYALKNGFLLTVVKQLRDYYAKLSLESVDCLRKVADKKRLNPVLQEIADLIALLNNFMLYDNKVKEEAVTVNLADILHKLWVWFIAQNVHLVNVLKMICTYTTDCSLACQSLPLTSSVAGSGPRRSPSTTSLLHSIIVLITKQMDQVSKTHDLTILELCFNILHNCCHSLECRILISKSNLFQSISRLHPAITKRQKPWESIELHWLDFLQSFTTHPEGQTAVAKTTDLLELIITMTGSSRINNRLSALLVLRNIAFYQPNKTRLLNSGDFLNVLRSKLSQGSSEEINIIVVIIWSLVANSQKTKVILRSAEIDSKLQNTLKQFEHMKNEYLVDSESLNRMRYVLSIIKDGDKIR